MRYTTFIFSNICDSRGVKVDNAALQLILRCQFVVFWLPGVLNVSITKKLFTLLTFE
jgi:hypothetical protein